MHEYEFELRVCARREAHGQLVARQLGGGVAQPGRRILDVLEIVPGESFDQRTTMTAKSIPDVILQSEIGPGRFRYWKDALDSVDVSREQARRAIEKGVEIGVLERSRRNGREYIRSVTRYPEDWFARLRAIENKPDLSEAGNLEEQLRVDVALGVVDEVIVATDTHVTGAHLNRLPESVGVWQLSNGIDVIREPEPLAINQPGIELEARHPGRTDVRIVEPDAKATARRRIAERAYGKGWRPGSLPDCTHLRPEAVSWVDGLPWCDWHERLIAPNRDCSDTCPGYREGTSTSIDLKAARDRTTPWVADPPDLTRSQARLSQFE